MAKKSTRMLRYLLVALIAALTLYGCKASTDDEGSSESESESADGAASTGESGSSGATGGGTVVPPGKTLEAAAELLGVEVGGFAAEAPVGNFATLSVTGEAGKFEPLAVDSLEVEVRVEGRLARTTVTQVFHNHQGRQAEGTYEFSLPDGASISRLAMDVEGKMMEGELVERERAREIYESIVRRKKDPALLEWQGGNRFKTQIFPIPANGTKTVVLAYEELLPESRDGLRYRYSLPVLQGAENAKDLGVFDFTMTTANKRDIKVEGYDAVVGVGADGASEVKFGAQDFVPTGPLTVRFDGQRTQEARVLYGKRTPVRVPGSAAGGAAPTTPPASERFMAIDLVPVVPALSQSEGHNVVVALDTSAGIGQRVLDQARLAALLLVDRVPEDRSWRIVHGDYSIQTCAPALEAAPCLKDLKAGGATDLEGLISKALDEAKSLEGPTAVVLLSDGVASLGLLDGDVIRGRVDKVMVERSDLSLHTVSVGHSASEGDMERLASAGRGHSLRMTPADRPDQAALHIAERIQEPVLRDVSVKVVKGDVSGFTPAVATSLERGEAIMALGKLTGDKATLMIEATYAGETLRQTVNLDWKAPTHDSTVVANFWARGWIEDMHRRGVNTADVVTHSLDYGVMSPYTSFLVLENDQAYKRFNVERRKEQERVEKEAAEKAENLKKSDKDLADVLKEDDRKPSPAPSATSGSSKNRKGRVAEKKIARNDNFEPTPDDAASAAVEEDWEESESNGEMGGGDFGLEGIGGGGGGAGEGRFAGPGRKSGKSSQGWDGGRRRSKPWNPPQARVRLQMPEASGSIDPQVIRRVAHAHKNEALACFEKQAKKIAGLRGTVQMKWTIDADGKTLSPAVVSDGVGSPKLAKCLTKVVKGWTYPAPLVGGLTVVDMAFGFLPADPSVPIADVSLAAQIAVFEALESPQGVDVASLASLYIIGDRVADAEKLVRDWLTANQQRPVDERFQVIQHPGISAHFAAERLALAAEVLAAGSPSENQAVRIIVDDAIAKNEVASLTKTLNVGRKLQADAAIAALSALHFQGHHAVGVQLLSAWQTAFGDDYILELTSDWDIRSAYGAQRFDALHGIATREPSNVDRLVEMLDALPGDDEGRKKAAQVAVETACSSAGATMNQCDNWIRRIYEDKRAEAMISTLRAKRLENMAAIRAHDVANVALIEEFAESLTAAGRGPEAERLMSEMVEFSPHDYAVRLNYAHKLDNAAKPVLACREYGVAVQLNPRQRDHFRDMMAERREHGDNVAKAIRECIVQGVSNLPVNRSISLILTWEDASADVDLHIREVGGHHVFYRSRESANGGLLYYDIRDGYGPEIYVLGSGPAGEYELSLVYFAGTAAGVSGTLTVLRNAGSANETREDFPFTLKGPEMDKEQPVTKFTIQ